MGLPSQASSLLKSGDRARMTQANRRTQLVACVLSFEAGYELQDAGGRRCRWALVTLHLRLRANGGTQFDCARGSDEVIRCGASGADEFFFRGDAVTYLPARRERPGFPAWRGVPATAARLAP
jgi:hypothetical protein